MPRRTRTSTAARILLLGLAACGDTTDVPGVPGASTIQVGTTIETADGILAGEYVQGARRFLGIPFAAPPVAERRWRPPARPSPWQGTRPATAFSSACPQLPALNGEPSTNEDCLYLNVWTPDPAPSEARPVMVWLHGGGNESGSASEPVPLGIGGTFYDGRALAAEHDVIVVTTNYRVGVFGFFAHPDLAREDPRHPYAGNQGLLDQQRALEWVRENIAAFGGDPENVTVFGESAGATDICLHLVAPGSHGLFHRAIAQSGGCTMRQRTVAEFAPDARRLATTVGCENAADALSCLRAQPVPDLLEGARAIGPEGLGPPVMTPVVDGHFLPDQPRTLFDAGEFAKVPYLVGSNSDEGTLFFVGAPPIGPDDYAEELDAVFGDLGSRVLEAYPAADFETPRAALVRAFGDFLLVCTTLDSARRIAAGGADVFLYNYAFPLQTAALQPLMLGASHGAEISSVFGSVPPPNPDSERVGRLLREYWTQHAHLGDPNGGDRPMWPRFPGGFGPRLNLDVEPSVLDEFRRSECAFWDTVFDADFE